MEQQADLFDEDDQMPEPPPPSTQPVVGNDHRGPESRDEFLARVAEEHYRWEGEQLADGVETVPAGLTGDDSDLWVDLTADAEAQQRFIDRVGVPDYVETPTGGGRMPLDRSGAEEPRQSPTIKAVADALIGRHILFDEALDLLADVRRHRLPSESWSAAERVLHSEDDPEEPDDDDVFWLEFAAYMRALTYEQCDQLARVLT